MGNECAAITPSPDLRLHPEPPAAAGLRNQVGTPRLQLIYLLWAARGSPCQGVCDFARLLAPPPESHTNPNSAGQIHPYDAMPHASLGPIEDAVAACSPPMAARV